MTAVDEDIPVEGQWFDKRPLDDETLGSSRQLLESYSRIPADEVVQHITDLRDEAWKIYPYPCIGHFRFLEAGITRLPQYDQVVKRVTKGEKFLDIGCCFGQTVRHLVADGAPDENIYACDLKEGFIKLGYKLFRDGDKLKANFFVADILDPDSAIHNLKGQIDIIYAGSFFHLFEIDKQIQSSKTAALLLRPRAGSMIIGRQVAGEPGVWVTPIQTVYRHNAETFKKLWRDISNELGIKFKVEVQERELPAHHPLHKTGIKLINFSIVRE